MESQLKCKQVRVFFIAVRNRKGSNDTRIDNGKCVHREYIDAGVVKMIKENLKRTILEFREVDMQKKFK